MIGFDTFGRGAHGVIITNDWLSDTTTWDDARRYLDLETFTWIFADLRGYGRSRRLNGQFTISEAASDVLDVATRCGWQSFSIVGHSMSALVALHLAQHHAEQIERVVLVTPSPPGGFGFDDVTMNALLNAATGTDVERLHLLNLMQGNRLSEQWIDFKLQRWRATADPDAVAAYIPMWARVGLPDMVTKIGCPLLAITGEQDREDMRGAAMTAALRPLVDDALVVPFAACGHAPMQEMPPLFATVVERFLKGAPESPQLLKQA